jgi:hypothetical protein
MADLGGPWWLVVDVVAVAILGAAIAYGLISWRSFRYAIAEKRIGWLRRLDRMGGMRKSKASKRNRKQMRGSPRSFNRGSIEEQRKEST